MPGQLVLRLHAVPFAVLFVALIALSIASVVLRGDRLVRLAFLLVALAAMPWVAGLGLAASTPDAALAEHFFRAGSGTIALIGAGLLFMILAVSGRIGYHRWMLVTAVAFALVTAVLEWTTRLMVDGVQMTRSGMWYAKAGPLNFINVGQIALWCVVGIMMARRGAHAPRDAHRRGQVKRVLVILGICVAGTADLLLAMGVVRIYPMAWAPALIATLLALHALLRTDLLQDRGIDRVSAVELGALIGAALATFAVSWILRRSDVASPLVLAMLTAPLAAGAMAIGLIVRAQQWPREPLAVAAERELEMFAESAHVAVNDEEVGETLAQLIGRHAGLGSMRLWRARGDLLVPVAAAPEAPMLDARVRAWLSSNASPMVVSEVGTQRLGGLRSLIEAFVTGLDADVVIPLVDRDALVGVATGQLASGRALRAGDREIVRDAATAAARSLTFVALTVEAAAMEGTAREVEVAEAVQAARAGNDVRVDVGAWRIAVGYRAASRVAGDVWSWAALPGDRLLVVLADVVGHGVPAALVSAAVAGACEAAAPLLGDAGPEAMLRLLHETVSQIGGGQRAGAFAVILDPGAGTARFASAGHRGGYLLRPQPGGAAEVTALGARGTTLGEPELVVGTGEAALAAGDWLVLVSDGVIEARNEAGMIVGERRILRALRDWTTAAGDRAAELLLHEATNHAGAQAIDDDLVVLAAHRRPVG